MSRTALAGIVLLMVALLVLWGRWIHLAMLGARAEATILDTQAVSYTTAAGQLAFTYTATYRFEAIAPDGAALSMTIQEPISRAWYETLQPDGAAPVRYVAENPSFAMLEGNLAKITSESFALIALTMAGLAALLAIAPLIDWGMSANGTAEHVADGAA